MLTIGELSKATGANISTIRHYERVGLLSPPARSDGNQRRYSDDDRKRLAFIARSRDLGISLDAIRDMLQLASDPPVPENQADRIIEEQLAAIRTKIGRLRKLEGELTKLSSGTDNRYEGASRVINVLAND